MEDKVSCISVSQARICVYDIQYNIEVTATREKGVKLYENGESEIPIKPFIAVKSESDTKGPREKLRV